MAATLAVGLAAPLASATDRPRLPAPGGEPEAGSTFFFFDTTQFLDFDFPFFPTHSALGDLDADGAPELVVTGRNGEGVIAIFPGVAGSGGPFGPPELLSIGAQTNSVALHDLDGDGVLDMVLGIRARPGRVAILDGVGDGTFSGRRDVSLVRDAAEARVTDVDGDGDPDIVACVYGSGDAAILLNDGAGGFSPPRSIPLGLALRAPARPFWVESGDLDGDAVPELVYSLAGSGHLAILPGGEGPDGTPGPARRLDLGTPTGIDLVDADDDGDLDIYTATWDSPDGMLTVLENDGAAGFTRLDLPVDGFFLWEVLAADLNGDGRDEALITEAVTGQFIVFENQSTPAGVAFATPQPFVIGDFPWHVLPADLDGDCDIDLVALDIANHRVQLLINLTEQQGGCAATDLDGDGRTGVSDLLLVLEAWGDGGGPADLDRDGTVGPLDLARVAGTREAGR